MRAVPYSLLLLPALALVQCHGPNAAPSVEKRGAALSSEPVGRKECTLVHVPGSDPKKPTPVKCYTKPIAPPSEKVIAAQQAYLAAWKKAEPSWKGLASSEREAELAKLKASFMAGVKP